MLPTVIEGKQGLAKASPIWNVINPATEEVVASLPFGGSAEAQTGIDLAAAAFPKWRDTNPYVRAEILKKAANLVRDRLTEFARTTTLECGKPLPEATGEWQVSAQMLDWFAEEAKRTYGQTIPSSRSNRRLSVIYQPIGVVGIITAWNFPAWNLVRAWGAALAAGCSIVAKPSEFTPLTAVNLHQALLDAGLPEGVANLVIGEGSEVGKALLERKEVRKIHFVGSTRVGKILMDGASKTNTKLSLELGGNNPAIIFPDVNTAQVAKSAALAKTRNCGQVCNSPQRFLVHEEIFDAFAGELVSQMEKLKIGNGLEDGTQVGPLINARQRHWVQKVVNETVAQGAKLLCGGEAPANFEKGYFFKPTVLAHVTPEMPSFSQEIFGPVIALTSFASVEEAIALANDTDYGLAGFVWTNDLRNAIKVSEALECGMAGVNDWYPHGTEAPFGGWKQSGNGYELGHDGILEYMEKKVIGWGI